MQVPPSEELQMEDVRRRQELIGDALSDREPWSWKFTLAFCACLIAGVCLAAGAMMFAVWAIAKAL